MKNKLTFWIITSVLSILVIYGLISTVLMPVLTKNPLPKASVQRIIPTEKENNGKNTKKDSKNTKKESKEESKDESENESNSESTSTVSGGSKGDKTKFYELKKQEILLHSRLELASEDSTYLILDLVNNKAILELKGVLLHECQIQQSIVSNSIKMYHTEALLNWMSEPFLLKHAEATIPKIEYIEKIAPKDSIEANKVAVEPVAAKRPDAFIVMDFERNLRLVILQSEVPDEDGKKVIEGLQRKYKDIEVRRSMQSLLKFNREPVMPQINIVIPKTDAIIFYKALPLKPRMILRM